MDKKHISKIYHNGDTLYVKDAEARETMVSGVSYDTTNKKIVETINGVNSDVVSVSTIKSDLNLTKSDVSLSNVTNDAQVKRTEMGVASGVATLDSAGKVPASQLPSYVDDVVEYASRSAFPETGETGKIYVDIAANEAYRWSGSQYVIISDSQVQANWNTTDTTSKSYIQNKPTNVSAFTNDAGYLTDHQSLDNYYNKTQTDSLLGGKQDTLVSGTNIKTINNNSLLGSGNIDIQTGGTYTEGNGIDITNDEISVKAGSNLSFDANGNLNATDTTYSVMGGSGASHASGLVPDPGATAGTTKYLREDGTWQTPAGQNYSAGDGIDITGNEISADNTIARAADLANEKQGNGIGTCSTSSGTALTATLTNYELVQNGFVAVTFANDVPANATLNINNKGAKAIYHNGSAIKASMIKAGDTVIFIYDGTNYVLSSGIITPETLTINLTQSLGSDSDIIGASITIKDNGDGSMIYSGTWSGAPISVLISPSTNYTIEVSNNVSGYWIGEENRILTYWSKPNYQRTVTFNYVTEGVHIEDTDKVLYNSSTWDSSKTANSVVFISKERQFRISLKYLDGWYPLHSNDNEHPSSTVFESYACLPYGYSGNSQAGNRAEIVKGDGEKYTDQIIAFNTAYGTNTTSYAAPAARAYKFPDNTTVGYIGCAREFVFVYNNLGEINTCLSLCGGDSISFEHSGTSNTTQIHTSDVYGGVNYKTCGINWGCIATSHNGGNLTNTHRVRPFGKY